MIAYLYAKTQDIDLAFAGISDHILLAKNGAGAIYYPELQINKIDALNPGEGYLVYMTAADTLECPVPPKTPPLKSKPTAGSIYTTKFANPSCNNATVILSSTMPDGTEITAYNTSGDILGSGLISNGVAAISIYGDDEFTDEIDGATSGENIRFKAQFANIEQDLELTDIKGVISNEEYSSITYHTNDLISAKVSNEVVSAAGLLGLYPNPTTNNAELSINLLQQSDLIIELYDNNGKRIKEVYQGQYINSLTIDTSDLPSGTYQVMVKTQNKTETIRLLIVK
jgi:hypothetical protein